MSTRFRQERTGTSDAQEINDTFTERIRRGIFNPIARCVSGYADAEDRLQDAIAQTWQLYQRHAAEGTTLDDALLVHHCKLRAIDPRRSIVPASGARCDVYDPRSHRRGKVGLSRGGSDGEAIGLAVEEQATPERLLVSAIDLDDWVNALEPSDQELIKYKHLGMSTADVAEATGMHYFRVYRRERKLGVELAARAGLTGRRPYRARKQHKED